MADKRLDQIAAGEALVKKMNNIKYMSLTIIEPLSSRGESYIMRRLFATEK